jgi:hypothetical protein
VSTTFGDYPRPQVRSIRLAILVLDASKTDLAECPASPAESWTAFTSLVSDRLPQSAFPDISSVEIEPSIDLNDLARDELGPFGSEEARDAADLRRIGRGQYDHASFWSELLSAERLSFPSTFHCSRNRTLDLTWPD